MNFWKSMPTHSCIWQCAVLTIVCYRVLTSTISDLYTPIKTCHRWSFNCFDQEIGLILRLGKLFQFTRNDRCFATNIWMKTLSRFSFVLTEYWEEDLRHILNLSIPFVRNIDVRKLPSRMQLLALNEEMPTYLPSHQWALQNSPSNWYRHNDCVLLVFNAFLCPQPKL